VRLGGDPRTWMLEHAIEVRRTGRALHPAPKETSAV
jgi:hypothetical protein